MALPPIDKKLEQTIRSLHGAGGELWLRRLPVLLVELADYWNLDLAPPFADLSYHYVAPAIRRADGQSVVLKAGFPGATEGRSEIAALRYWNGKGIARLMDADESRGALLLEYVRPGVPLSLSIVDASSDEQATRAAAGVMRRLWKAAPAPVPRGVSFPTVADWGADMGRLRTVFAGGVGPFTAALVEEAERSWADLLASQDQPVLLHGDLHHQNILSASHSRPAGEEWLAIDPKGVWGEPAYEVGAFLRNPLPLLLTLPDPEKILARRVQILSEELSLTPERVRGWGIAQAFLSAWWSWEDSAGQDTDLATLRCAELLSRVRLRANP